MNPSINKKKNDSRLIDLLKAFGQKNYGKLIKKQVQGKDGKQHTVYVNPNPNQPVKEKSKDEQIKERRELKQKVEGQQPKHSEEDQKKIKEITDRHTQFEAEAKEQRKGYGSGPMVPKVGAIMRVYAKGKANVGGMLGKIKEIAEDGKSMIVQLTSGNTYSFGLDDLQFAKSSIFNVIQILKARRRNDGETWTQPSGRKVTKKNGKIVPVKGKVQEKKEEMKKDAPLDTIPLDKMAILTAKDMQEAKDIYNKVKDLPESELKERLERLKKVPGNYKIPGMKALEHALEKFNITPIEKQIKEENANKIREVVRRTKDKTEKIDSPLIVEPATENKVDRGINTKNNEISTNIPVDNSKKENNFDTMPETKEEISSYKRNSIKETIIKEKITPKVLEKLNDLIYSNKDFLHIEDLAELRGLASLMERELKKPAEQRRTIKELSELDLNKIIQDQGGIGFEKMYESENNFDTMPESIPEKKPQSITASNITIALDQLLKLDLEQDERNYLERVKAVKNKLPDKQIEQIQNSIRSMDVKDKDFVISTIKNYITDSILKYGETAPPSIDKPAKTTKVQEKVIAAKLRNLAEGLDKQIDNLKNSAIGQQNPTRRRSGIAANMYERGEKLEEIQVGLRGLSDLWEKGEVPPELQSIRSKSDLDFINYKYKYFKKYPKDDMELTPWIRTYRINDLSKFLNGLDYNNKKIKEDYRKDYGGKLINIKPEYLLKHGLIDNNFMKDAKEVVKEVESQGGNVYNTNDQNMMKKMERVLAQFALINDRKIQINSSTNKPYYTQKSSGSEKFNNKEYSALGIQNMDELMQAGEALEKIISGKYSPETPKTKLIKDKERNLLGNKIPGFFPTPKPVIDKAMDYLDIKPGMKVLEPSAGKGDMADVMKEAGAEVDVVEPYSSLREILNLKDHNVIEHDIMDVLNEEKYDRILMNPPFEKGQDIDHTMKAYQLLKPGGRMVSIVSEGPFFRKFSKDENFRNWLDAMSAQVEKLPEGSFKNAFVSTGVNTRMIVIDKPYDY